MSIAVQAFCRTVIWLRVWETLTRHCPNVLELVCGQVYGTSYPAADCQWSMTVSALKLLMQELLRVSFPYDSGHPPSSAASNSGLLEFNLELNLIKMKTVTMLELRQNAEAVVQDLRSGLTLTLTYRGHPLARLEPIRPSAENIAADDSLYQLAEQAGLAEADERSAKGNARLTNADIDRALYGR